MHEYEGNFIEGLALLVHPFSKEWQVGGIILARGSASSIIEVARFEVRFAIAIKELAEWFGLELARIAVDELLAPDK